MLRFEIFIRSRRINKKDKQIITINKDENTLKSAIKNLNSEMSDIDRKMGERTLQRALAASKKDKAEKKIIS